jgi:threonylcarbamoyladenosine tRNA methylthiotransferase MtaB
MKVFLDTIGCRLNQSEIEVFARQFRAAGHQVVGSASEADIVVVNTCTVTGAAAADSRQKIRQVARAGVENIVVTGCWATLEQAAAEALVGVQNVIPNLGKDDLVARVLNLSPEDLEKEPIARTALPGLHRRTRAFIKVQDGCDNYCTYCITRLARGKSRSYTVEQVLSNVRSALEGGSKEVVLTGVQLGSYGRDLPIPRNLSDLVNEIFSQTSVPRLRLSSLEPWEVDEALLSCWQDHRMCRHLHLPLQSGSSAILQRMGRRTTPKDFFQLVDTIRRRIPAVAVTTDIITGFPGESDEEFNTSLAFVRQIHFAHGHVFTYSPRPGTTAARLPNQVPDKIKKARSIAMREVFTESAQHFRSCFTGQVESVLWESAVSIEPDEWVMTGLTDHYLRVSANASKSLWNEISSVRLTADGDEVIRGEIVTDQALGVLGSRCAK